MPSSPASNRTPTRHPHNSRRRSGAGTSGGRPDNASPPARSQAEQSPAQISLTAYASRSSNAGKPSRSDPNQNISGPNEDEDMHARNSGATAELASLIPLIQPRTRLRDRLDAAKRIINCLTGSPSDNIESIWSAAQDLIDPSQSFDVRRTGYKLLKQCAASVEPTSELGRTLLKSLAENFDSKNLDIQLAALQSLLSHMNTLPLPETLVVELLISWLDKCFRECQQTRGFRPKGESQRSMYGHFEEANLVKLFDIVTDYLTAQSHALDRDRVQVLLSRVLEICQKTTAPNDLRQCLAIFDVAATHNGFSEGILEPCFETLCGIYQADGLDHLQPETAIVASKLLETEWADESISILMNNISHPEGRWGSNLADKSVNNVRGAVKLCKTLLLSPPASDVRRLSTARFLEACKGALSTERMKLEEEVMKALAAFFLNDQSLQLLVEEDWSEFVDIVSLCMQRQLLRGSTRRPPSQIKIEHGVYETEESIRAHFHVITDGLNAVYDQLEQEHQQSTLSLFLQNGRYLSTQCVETLIKQCTQYQDSSSSLGSASSSLRLWKVHYQQLVDIVLKDQSRPKWLRLFGLRAFHNLSSHWLQERSVDDLLAMVFMTLESMGDEFDQDVLRATIDYGLGFTQRADIPDSIFGGVLEHLRKAAESNAIDGSQSPRVSGSFVGGLSQHTSLQTPVFVETTGSIAATAIVRLFINYINLSATRALEIYKVLLEIASSDNYNVGARIKTFKLLFRIRSDSEHRIFIIAKTESENLAASLCRTQQTATGELIEEEGPPIRSHHNDEASPGRLSRTVSGNYVEARLRERSGMMPNRMLKPRPPLWMYPGPAGLPEEPPSLSSETLFSRLEEETMERKILKVDIWLELVIRMLQNRDTDWELYSYILVHLGAQIANQSLFLDAVPFISVLRNTICDHVRSVSFKEPPASSNLERGDVAVCLYQILTMLICYKIGKSEENDLVRVFFQGIGQYPRTSKPCIHALSICCHEFPDSITKYVQSILQRMSQIITQSHVTVHILEFLAGLARLPRLCANFKEDEFKLVFGICFRYLQSVRDRKGKSQMSPPHGNIQKDTSISGREVRSNTATDDLPQYVYALAYHTISFWFMALRMQDRPKYMAWISKSLVYQDTNGNEGLEDQARVTIDMMQRVASCDRDETAPVTNFASEEDGPVNQRTWLVGDMLWTVETAGRSGVSQITQRRPSGTRYSIYRPSLVPPPMHQIPLTTGLEAERFSRPDYVGIYPESIFQEFYFPLSLAGDLTTEPVVLPEDSITKRAISSFDRNTAVDGHKIGIIYIDEGQFTEETVLPNEAGSLDYTDFIESLGTKVRLKDANFNTQGLDRGDDGDGKYTICWRDRVTEIVFHIVTMMPTDLKNDPRCTRKKSHIGNDFINIIWNNSGRPYVWNTFPSDFNYVSIVITPEARISSRASMTLPQTEQARKTRYYKVQVLRQPGFPEVSPVAETKVISGESLPAFTRLVALNASVFSQVWKERGGGEHVSSWRNRLREIDRLRERHLGSNTAASSAPQSPAAAATHPSDKTSSIRDSGSLLRRASVVVFGSKDSDKEGNKNTLGADIERLVSGPSGRG